MNILHIYGMNMYSMIINSMMNMYSITNIYSMIHLLKKLKKQENKQYIYTFVAKNIMKQKGSISKKLQILVTSSLRSNKIRGVQSPSFTDNVKFLMI